MMKRSFAPTVLSLLLAGSAVFAQAPAGQAPAARPEPVTPTTIIENDDTRIVRVDILPNATRSMHDHPDMIWHVFVAMDQPIVLNIQGMANPVKLAPWQSHFFKGGTMHSITNPNPRQAQFMEFFAKKK